MLATDLFNWAPTLSIQPNEGLITICVSPTGDVFHAHRQVLVRNSAFFEHALGNRTFAEAKSGKVSLPEADSQEFAIWLDWAYNGRIPSAVLDVKLRQNDSVLTSQALSARRHVISAASWQLMTADASERIINDVRERYTAEVVARLSKDMDDISISENTTRQEFLSGHVLNAPTKKQGLRRLIQHADESFNELARKLGMVEESRELKSYFSTMCEAKVLAAQKDPELRQNFVGEHDSGSIVDEEMRPSFVNLVRLYHLADFLLSEKCRNAVIDAVAELSYHTKYVPNAVDVGELWGYDDEIGDIEELRSPERTRSLKQLIRRIYCSKNTSKLILQEQDPYPELFLREISVLSREKADNTEKWAWSIPSSRCNAFHVHKDTPSCAFGAVNGNDVDRRLKIIN